MRQTIFRILNWFTLLLLLTATVRPGAACDIPGMEAGERPWVTLLIEDHPGMREVIWDAAFTDLNTAGPFLKDHRYALVTAKTPYLEDEGCWDQSMDCGHRGHDDDRDHDQDCDKDHDQDKGREEAQRDSCPDGPRIGTCTWTSDRKGVILKVGTHSTWIPAAALFSGGDCPPVTFRGSYLNWLLLNRGKTPSIPTESRWQRVQRVALAMVRELLTRGSGAPKFRIVGIGTSGRLLIPPGEGLSAGENAVARMEPSSRGGSMEDALERVLRAIREHHDTPCVPNIAFLVSDGNDLANACGSAKRYEACPSYADLLTRVSDIQATGRAEVWAWDVDGNGTWTQDVALRGAGKAFSGEAVVALDAAIKAWVSAQTAPLQITLVVDQPPLTRVTPVRLAIQSNHFLQTLSLNGLPVAPTGLITAIPLPLQEGLNAFTVDAKDFCGGHSTTGISLTLDTIPPRITLVSPLEGLQADTVLITAVGQVDDPAAALTVNGAAVPLNPTGAFSTVLNLVEGPFTITASAMDLVGNVGTTTRNIVVEWPAPKITLNAIPALTNKTSLQVPGSVDDPAVRLTLNGQAVSLDASGAFITQAMLGVEGENILHFEAVNAIGKVGKLDARTVRDTTPPVVTIASPSEGWISNLHSVTVSGGVDEPSAHLLVGGQSISADAQGHFESVLGSPSEGAQLLVALATDPAGNTGHATRGFTLDWTPPVLSWIAPTPDEGALVTKNTIPVSATVSETASVDLNGNTLTLTPSTAAPLGVTAAPYFVQTELAASEGQVVLALTAIDRAANSSRIERRLELGLTTPVIQVAQPTLDTQGIYTTRDDSTTLNGTILAPPFVWPLRLSANGKDLALDAANHFSLPVTLAEGDNPVRLIATNRFGQTSRQDVLVRRYTTSFGIELTWPLDGMATFDQSTEVMGRVLREGISVTLNGTPVSVGTDLQFKTVLPLTAGENLIQAVGLDSVGNRGTAQVRVTCTPPKNASYRWDTPVSNARSRIRTVSISGQADLPGITSISVDGVPMELSGSGKDGKFNGRVSLGVKGRITLSLEARTMAGEVLRERRDVIYQPDLPLIRLLAPTSARPGETVAIQVLPEPGTSLVAADLRFNDRLLAQIISPFAAQQAVIPADAQIGSRIPVEAVGTDAEGETVTARSYITVYGSGALLQQVVDDRTAMPLVGATVAVENGESGSTDATGRVALSTALPTSWIKISKDGFSPVWRSAALKQVGVEASLDARPTPLESLQSASGSPLTFGKGAMTLQAKVNGDVSATPLSAQGLPGLAPIGWSAVSAWWIAGEALPAMAALKLEATLPSSAVYTWARWDDFQHLWVSLAPAAHVDSLPVPQPGGYALLMPDPSPTTPPVAQAAQPVPPYSGSEWRDGFTFNTGEGPHVMSTVEAIRGARMEARLNIGFAGLDPVPSGAPLQAELLENYTLVDQRVIEPESFTQDLFAHRWELTVVEGAPVVECAGEGLLLKQLVRMSRAFTDTELVQGRLVVSYFHDGVRVADTGSGLVGAEGGSVSSSGITAILSAGSVTGAALVRITPDTGDLSTLWPEIAGVKSAFQIDVVGNLLKGLGISLDSLDASDTARPILVQRRVVQGQRLLLAVGEMQKSGSTWFLVTPEGGNPVLEGGAFAVLVPGESWDWVSGTVTMPESMALPMIQKLGAKAGLIAMKTTRTSAASSKAGAMGALLPGDVTVADASVEGGYLLAVSGSAGSFAVPVFVPVNAASVPIKGTRWDLGIAGSMSASVPSADNALRLATVPFAVTQILPSEAEVVAPASVLQVLTSTPVDPMGFQSIRLFQDGTLQTEIVLRSSLSQDGRTLLLTPERSLPLNSRFILKVESLRAQSGESAPNQYRRFQTAAQAAIGDVDFSRIQLGYPDAQNNTIVTIPEGAVPPWSIVSVEATEMGSCGQGVMPPARPMEFPLKTSLGERIHITVLLRDGRSSSGYIGRYVAEDGRTTLGVDGGRVEGPGGVIVVVPEGALDRSAEMQVLPADHVPIVPETALNPGESLLKGIRLQVKGGATFKKQPILEIPVASLPGLNPQSVPPAGETELFGNGPLAIFQERKLTLPDGTEDVFNILVDTAQFSSDGLKVVSLGGLRLSDPAQGTVIQQLQLAASAQVSRQAPVSAKASQSSKSTSTSAPSRFAIASSLIGTAEAISEWNWAVLNSMYYYHQGTVYRNWNGSGPCSGSASSACYGPLAYAEVHRYAGTVGLDEARKGRLSRGRLLAVADPEGRYMNVGGPDAGAIGGQRWISLFAVDSRTGETSIDPDSPDPLTLGLPWERRNHSLAITSQGGNPFDPTLTAPRIRAQMVDENGSIRSMFAVGDHATLKILTESGSQSVVRGKVSGALEQEFGALPQEMPVSFTTEGTWSVSILGWTAKPVQGATSLTLIVTPTGQLGQSVPGKPTIMSKDPGQGDEQVEPSSMVKLTFSEPVRSVTASSFDLQVNGASVPFQVVSNGQLVTDATTLVQQVWLTPDQRMSLGATVKVAVRGSISDQDGEVLEPVSWSFTVRGADVVGSLAGVGKFSQMVTHNGRIFAVEDVGAGYFFDSNGYNPDEGLRMHGIRIIDATDPSNPTKGPIFGQYRSWDPPTADFNNLGLHQGPFAKSSVTGLRVVTGVSIGGKVRDVLLASTRPWLDQEIIAAGDSDLDIADVIRFRQNALWVFDITDDAESMEDSMGKTLPKLLMTASQGTTSPNWLKGIGGAGGMLGSIKLRGGMSLWDADKWKSSWNADWLALSDWTIRYRTVGRNGGYFPDPQSLVASNGFYNAAGGSQYSVMSSVFSEDTNGQPIAYAAMGYSNGILALIDGRVGQPESLATFMGGGPKGMDSRIHDLSMAVNGDFVNLVEVIKGTWQGPSGAEQGSLLLPGTTIGTGGKFWVLKPDLSDLTNPGAAPLGYANLPARITRIVPDPARMLVGVEANSHAYIFDLKNLTGSGTGPMLLTPIYDFTVNGVWTLDNGMLYDGQTVSGAKNLVVKNLDGKQITPMLGIPLRVDVNQWLAGVDTPFANGEETQLMSIRQTSKVGATGDGTPLPRKLMYAMTKLQGTTGYPFLRYYYPDLGDMQISAMMEYADPRTFEELSKDTSTWFVEAKGELIADGAEIPGAMDIQALKINRGAGEWNDTVDPLPTLRSRLYGDGEQAKLELMIEQQINENIPKERKFAYAPFRFAISPSVLAARAQDMRTDRKERFRVKIHFKLYANGSKYPDKPTQIRNYEFLVKFNSNTTVHDVIRGGVWHYDPEVSATDPGQTMNNPAMRKWETFLRSHPEETELAMLPQEIQQRLSLTVKKEQPASLGEVPQVSYALQDMALDEVQAGLERALPMLRRQVFSGINPSGLMGPMPLSGRPTFSAPVYTGDKDPSWTWHKGDPMGAYGYRMAQVVNALQSFSIDEIGDPARTIDKFSNWGSDPASFPWEKDPKLPEEQQIDGRILPILHQQFKLDAQTYNPHNVMVHYLVAYPKLRSTEEHYKGRYPIHTLLTRDLLVGPAGISLMDATLKGERQRIDQAILGINALTNRSEANGKQQNDYKYQYEALEVALKNQQIIASSSSGLNSVYYNQGLGILQLAFSKNWHLSFPGDGVPYLPFQNSLVHFMTVDPQDWNYAVNPAFNSKIEGNLGQFMYDHIKAGRVEVLINGIQNKAEEIDEAAQALQRKMDAVLDVQDSAVRTPVIAQYNVSSKLYYGRPIGPQRAFDLWDCISQKEDTANPDRVTTNPDSIRLIATLRAVTKILWSRDYQLAFYQAHLDPLIPQEYWWYFYPGGQIEARSIGELLSADSPLDKLEDLGIKRIPKYHATFAEDYPAGGPDINVTAEAFKARMKAEFIRLYAKLATMPVTFHAHSQGSIIAAVVHSRLGSVPATRMNLQGAVQGEVSVADKIDLVTYGGGANMYDWGPRQYYKSYAHHVNRKDAVANLLGMGDPFQGTLKTLLISAGGKGDLVENGSDHADQIKIWPPSALREAWKLNHKVIYHESSAKIWNTNEHNMSRGYICNVAPDPSTLTALGTPNKHEGRKQCLE